MRDVLRVVSFFLVLTAGAGAVAAERAIIVLDASGSMWGQIEGETKMSIAQETLAEVLSTVPDTVELGFVAYGHREKGNCADIELIVPPAPASRGEIAAAANRLIPLGKTPLTDAVRQAAVELRYTDEKATVILITDGIETCVPDPCAVAAELERAGVDLTVHVVGFGLSEQEGRQVACLAENTGGQYFPASDASLLSDALSSTVTQIEPPPPPQPAPSPEPEPESDPSLEVLAYLAEGVPFEGGTVSGVIWEGFRVDESGPQSAGVISTSTQGNMLSSGTLEPGQYLVRVTAMLASGETTVEVKPDEKTQAIIVLNAGVMRTRALMSESQPVPGITGKAVEWRVLGPAGDVFVGYGPEQEIVLPAGPWTLRASMDNAAAELPVDVTAGATEDATVILNAGVIRAHAVASEGRPILAEAATGVEWRLIGPPGDVFGVYGTEYETVVSAGSWVVRAKLNNAIAERLVEVAVEETEEFELPLAVGRLMLRPRMSGGSPPSEPVSWRVTGPDGQDAYCGLPTAELVCDLAAGEYRIKATLGAASVEEQVSVPAGEAVVHDVGIAGVQ